MTRRMQRASRFSVALFLIVGMFAPFLAANATTCPTSGSGVTIAASCTYDTGTYTFSGTLTINSGVTVTINGAVVLVSDSIDVEGTISANATGSAGGTGTGAGQNGFGTNGPGAGYGGNGSKGSGGATAGGVTYGSVTAPTSLGSGGGNTGAAGGAGGGAVELSIGGAGTITVNGTVSANGGASTGTGGSGSGGSVWINAPSGSIAGSGSVTATGGTPSSSNPGGGGGGRIAVYYATDSSTLLSGGKVTAYGGGLTTFLGGAGTVYVKTAAETNGELLVNNNNQNAENTTQVGATSLTFDLITIKNGGKYIVPSTSTLTMASGATLVGGGTTHPTLTINSGATFNLPAASTTLNADMDVTVNGAAGVVTDLTVNTPDKFIFSTATGSFTATLNSLTVGTGTFSTTGTGTFTVPTITVQSGGTLTHETNTNTQANKLIVSATTVNVQTGGTISVLGKGFSTGNGTGITGHTGFGTNGPGAGYGGNGAKGVGGSSAGGDTYGDAKQPSDIGSGGDNSAGQGSAGGGAVKLTVSGTLTVNGSINANGATSGSNGGAGSGGSVWIASVGTLAGAGTITANGGATGSSNPGGGGGGRVSITYTTDTSSLLTPGTSTTAFGGGSGTNIGGSGTIYLFHTGTSTNGDFYVDNNNQSGNTTTQFTTPATLAFDNATIDKGSKYVVPNTGTLTVSSSGTLTTGGTARPTLTINSGGVFNPPSTGVYTFTNIDVTNNGTVNTLTNITVNNSTYVHNGTFGATVTDVTCAASGTFVFQTANTFSPTTVLVQNTGTFEQRMVGTVSVANLTVQNGGTVTHTANTTSKTSELNLSSTSIDVQTGGSINVVGRGFSTGNGTGITGHTGFGTNGPGAGYGGDGAKGVGGSSSGGSTYGSAIQPTDIGSGGDNSAGQGSAGGGAVKLTVSGTLTVNGTINANGGTSGSNGGSGSGGSIWLNNVGTLAGAGSITANGGATGSSSPGGGGGGRIAIYYTTNTSSFLTPGTGVTAFGGGSGSDIGGSGTIVLFNTGVSTNGDLYVDNNNQNGTTTTQFTTPATLTFDDLTIDKGTKYVIPSAATLTLASGATFTGGGTSHPTLTNNSGGTFNLPSATYTANQDIDITNNGAVGTVTNLTVNSPCKFIESTTTGSFSAGLSALTVGTGTFSTTGTGTLTVTTVTVQSGGTLTHEANTNAQSNKLIVSATTFDLQTGGSINLLGKGFSAANGTGISGHTGFGNNGPGAGYGGDGAKGVGGSSSGGSTYGDAKQPTDIGSGGDNSGGNGSAGGGAVKLTVSGTLTVNGTINANAAAAGANGGGGSGGSVWLNGVGTLAGSGTISANGGSPSNGSPGGGGGGRISISYTSDTSTLISSGTSITAFAGGSGSNIGGAGTIFLKAAAAANGDFIVDNNNQAGTTTTQFTTPATLSFDNLTIKNKAAYVIPSSGTSVLSAATSTTIAANSSLTTNNTNTLALGAISVSGTLTTGANLAAQTAALIITGASVNVASGGTITTNGLGYSTFTGTGSGTNVASGNAGGGGYGGAGGTGAASGGAGGATYGSSTSPVDIGANGGKVGANAGGAGGGRIDITVTGNVTIAGSVTSNGAAATNTGTGGGAGGTVKISTTGWAGAGTISANGGAGQGVVGGCGGGGRIYISYSTKTFSTTPTVTGACAGSGTRAGADGTEVEVQNAPTVTSVTHTPTSPFVTDVVSVTGNATYTGGLAKIELYMDGTNPANLQHTCVFSGSPTSGSCTISVGTLSRGSHTTTAKAYGVDTTTATGTETFIVSGSTTGGVLILGRDQVSVTTSFDIQYTLSGTSNVPLVVTFPAGFTVNSSFTSGSPCLSAFGHTSNTLTATVTNCSGTVVASGASITNPPTPGVYVITWTDDSGSGSVTITTADQVNVNAAIDPQITFNVGSQASVTACSGTFAGNGGALALGTLTTGSVTSSDVSSVPHICTRVTANGSGGAVLTVRSSNAGLKSTSVPADSIPSSTGTVTAGVANYGLCAGSGGTDSGLDVTVPAGASPIAASPFNGSCSAGAHAIGGLTTSAQNLWTLSGASQNAYVRLYLKAAISGTTVAHSDYGDTLTFTVTGTY